MGGERMDGEFKTGVVNCPEHATWWQMWQRCSNPHNKAWPRYGGRGICVCERWRDFFAFVEDTGKRPPARSLDRIDVNGDYEPANCRWATQDEQINNRRNTVRITIDGAVKSLTQWSRQFGVARATVKRRFLICEDWKQAFELAKRNFSQERQIEVTINGKRKSLLEWCNVHGIPAKIAWQRHKRGWPWKKSVTEPLLDDYAKRDFLKCNICIGAETKGFNEWCKHFGIAASTVWKRINNGESIHNALQRKPDKSHSHGHTNRRIYEIGGVTMCLADWVRQHGADYALVLSRVRRGSPIEKALTDPRDASKSWNRNKRQGKK